MAFVPSSARHHGRLRQTAIDRLKEAGAVRVFVVMAGLFAGIILTSA